MKTPRTLAIAALLVCVSGLACGGDKSKKAPEEPPLIQARPHPDPGGDELIPADKFDELKAFFDRKARVIGRCYGEAIEAGDLPKSSEGYVTVKLTVERSGALRDVAVAESTLESEALHRCIIATVEDWTATSLPRPLDYSYTFAFSPL